MDRILMLLINVDVEHNYNRQTYLIQKSRLLLAKCFELGSTRGKCDIMPQIPSPSQSAASIT